MNDTLNSPLSPYARRLQHGLAVANRKMMCRASVFDYSLVIGLPDGNHTEKPAKELLGELQQTDWWTLHFGEE